MTKELQMTELLPCPMCDDKHAYICKARGNSKWFVVTCYICGTSTGPRFPEAEAIAAWNTRTPAKVAGVDVDGLKATFAKATQSAPGDWFIYAEPDVNYGPEIHSPDPTVDPRWHAPIGLDQTAVLESIVALHNAFPALIAKIEADAARVAALEGALNFYAANHEWPNEGPWGVDSNDFGNVARAAMAATEDAK